MISKGHYWLERWCCIIYGMCQFQPSHDVSIYLGKLSPTEPSFWPASFSQLLQFIAESSQLFLLETRVHGILCHVAHHHLRVVRLHRPGREDTNNSEEENVRNQIYASQEYDSLMRGNGDKCNEIYQRQWRKKVASNAIGD
jgi:hypothetical protein